MAQTLENPVEGVPAAPEYAIEIEGMRKAYGRTVAVRNLSMHVPRGSVYGFVGPNGAGKTTTIRTLATLQKPDAGTVRVAGMDVRKNAGDVRDRVGYMPDFFGVYESLTVSEYLDFYGASHRIPVPRRRQLCGELLELVDLTDKRSESVEALSRGMKQRLGLARCLVHDPDVLLLDEPASGMDPRARIELREILRELCKLDKTILISSHILPELSEMCTHIGVIRAGEMIAEGSVDAVIGALTSGARLRIRVLSAQDTAAMVTLLEADPLCENVVADGDRSVIALYRGGDDELAALLVQAVSTGVQLTGFGVEGNTLEDVFLQITELSEVRE